MIICKFFIQKCGINHMTFLFRYIIHEMSDEQNLIMPAINNAEQNEINDQYRINSIEADAEAEHEILNGALAAEQVLEPEPEQEPAPVQEPVSAQDLHNVENNDQNSGKKYTDPDLTLCILKRNFRNFNFKTVFTAISRHGAVKSVLIKSYGKPATYGFAFFESKDALDNFVASCTYNEEHDAYLLNVGDEILTFRKKNTNDNFDKKKSHQTTSTKRPPRQSTLTDENVNKSTSSPDNNFDSIENNVVRTCKKIFVKGLPEYNAQIVLNEIIKDMPIESITIVIKPQSVKAVVVFENGEHGQKLINESYENKGIKHGDNVLTIYKFKNMAARH